MFRGRRPLNTKKKFCITADYDFPLKISHSKIAWNWWFLKKFLQPSSYVFGAFLSIFWGPEPREDLFSLIALKFTDRQGGRWKLGMFFYYYYWYKTAKQTTWLNKFLNYTMLASFEITCDHLNRTSWYRDLENFFPIRVYKNFKGFIRNYKGL